MKWSNLLERQPRLADIAHERLIGPGVLLVVTIRRDGTPRLSPVEPFLLDGELWLSMMWGSRKAADLERDPRLLVHSIVTGPSGEEGEVKLRGSARYEPEADVQSRYARAIAEALPWSPEVGHFHLFAVDIASVTVIRYDNATGDQHVATWPPGREVLRRGTSATSLGDPDEVRDLLVEE
jgi:hypothetical protein